MPAASVFARSCCWLLILTVAKRCLHFCAAQCCGCGQLLIHRQHCGVWAVLRLHCRSRGCFRRHERTNKYRHGDRTACVDFYSSPSQANRNRQPMRRSSMKSINLKFASLLIFLFAAAGCKPQAPVSPPPSATVSWTALPCPTGYSCGYIVSSATCSSPTVCPTPSSGGPYTPKQTASSPLTTNTYTDTAPSTGVYEAYTVQFVETPTGGSPATGAPSPASAPVLIALYPGTPGQPSATSVAELAPPLSPDASQKQLASNWVPLIGRPTVKVSF